MGKDGDAWTTTTTISAAATVASTELRDYGFDDLGGNPAGSGDDVLEDYWVIILGSNNDGVVRRIKSYDASAGEITVYGTDLSAESGSVDFEIHKWSPTYLRDCLNDARLIGNQSLFTEIQRQVFTSSDQHVYEVPSAIVGEPTSIFIDRTLGSDLADNILSNPGFEDWTSGSPDSWTATTLDVTQESTTTSPGNFAVYGGDSSVRCTSRTGNTGTLLQSISSPSTHSGQRVSVSVLVYCLTASKVRTQITINSTTHTGTTADGGEHLGNGWQLLTHYEDATTTVSTLNVGIRVDSDATDNTEFYVDEVISTVGPLQESVGYGDELRQWDYVPVTQGSTRRNEVVFPYSLPDLHLLKFVGKGNLSSVSSETDTMEIDAPQIDLLYAYAARELYGRQNRQSDNYSRDLALAERDLNRLSMHGMHQPTRKIKIPDWVY